MHLSIRVFGDTQFDRELASIGRRAQQAQPIFEATGFYLAKVQREQFASQGGRSGGWEPRKSGGDWPILDKSGALKRSFQYGDANNIWDVTGDSLHYGSEVDYGVHHQFGAPAANLPMRKVFELSERDRKLIVKSWQRWVFEGSTLNLEYGII